jgi:hypothetical protein
MINGDNNWNVRYSHIQWLTRLLNQHTNVESVSRNNDIIFTVKRIQQGDSLKILCLNEYIFSITQLRLILEQFPDVNIIYIGGGWNGYTRDALALAHEQGIGIYVTDYLTGALWSDNYGDYFKRDGKGNPVYHYART